MREQGGMVSGWLAGGEDRTARRTLLVLLGVGLLIHLLGFLLFRIEVAAEIEMPASDPFVVFVAPSQHPEVYALLREVTEIADPSRLLLPASLRPPMLATHHSTIREPIRFPLVNPELRLGTQMMTEALPVSIGLGAVTPETLLELSHWRIFDQVGRRSPELRPLAAGQQRFVERPVELHRMQQDGSLKEIDIARLAPFAASERRLLEGPLEISFRVDDRGLLSPAAIRVDPGNPSFVEAVMAWLRTPQNLAVLDEGTYQLRIYP